MKSTMVRVRDEVKGLYAQGYSSEGKITARTVMSVLPASGALRSTASDMLKFLQANLEEPTFTPLNKAIKLSQRDFFKVNERLTIGLGWQRVKLDDNIIVEKNGGLPGFSTYIGMIPAKKGDCRAGQQSQKQNDRARSFASEKALN